MVNDTAVVVRARPGDRAIDMFTLVPTLTFVTVIAARPITHAFTLTVTVTVSLFA